MAHSPAVHSSAARLDSSCVFIAGPTAVGKSEVALALAEKIGGEIISADSMQVYRGLDIGTAKPTSAERARVPHHLLDIRELKEPFDAAQFVQCARTAIAEIRTCGRTPIVCGGTGLYFKALLEGLGSAPPSDQALRTALEAVPLADLLVELRERDPATFETIDRQNPRRVIRAVEVIRLTGKTFSEQRTGWKPKAPTAPKIFAFTRANEDLHVRIHRRVDEMFRRGLVAETEQLLKHGLAENQTAMQAIGYRQVVAHLHGEHTLAETMELVKIRTRQFAKRQLTWFRRQLDCEWLELSPDSSTQNVLGKIELLRDQTVKAG
jgi:tRNA dimethylallyltransferase